jgi:hypothetical protein
MAIKKEVVLVSGGYTRSVCTSRCKILDGCIGPLDVGGWISRLPGLYCKAMDVLEMGNVTTGHIHVKAADGVVHNGDCWGGRMPMAAGPRTDESRARGGRTHGKCPVRLAGATGVQRDEGGNR